MSEPQDLVLDVRDLAISLDTAEGRITPAGPLDFRIHAGEIVGLVGESGSGKTVTSLAIMGLLPRRGTAVTGQVSFCGQELVGLPERQLNELRGSRLTMIFQEPMSALNPAIRVGEHIAQVLRVHQGVGRRQARDRSVELMARVGIPDAARRARDHPHAFSGGMRQRIMIAMALACSPALMIADEPTTALDVTVQAEILALLRELQAETGMAMLYITHDLDVVAEVGSSVLVMYAGQIVERGSVDEVFGNPRHPYTWSLLRSRDLESGDGGAGAGAGAWAGVPVVAPGAPPSPSDFPSGCRFHPRCPFVDVDVCTTDPVPLELRGDREVRCAREGIL